jgi:hypothetical protein
MKYLLIVLLIVVLSLSFAGLVVRAQLPLPTPVLLPLATMQIPGAGMKPISTGYPPTWTAPPTTLPMPTATPNGYVTLTAVDPAPVYGCPVQVCYLMGTLPRGTVFQARPASPGWWQVESGWAWGSYVQDSTALQR